MQSKLWQLLEQISLLITNHLSNVYLLAFVICVVFSLAMLTSYRRAKTEKWMKYFGIAAGILAAQYFAQLVLWYVSEYSLPIVKLLLPTLSTANNIWFIATAREIENRKPAFPRWCWMLAGGTIVGYFLTPQDNWLSIFLARSFDTAFSALSLVLIVKAIYMSISFRVRRMSAFLTMLSALIYAVPYIVYWFSPMMARLLSTTDGFSNELRMFDSLLVAVSLPLKILIFIPAYILSLRFIEALDDLMKLQDKAIGARQDYLSSEGVVRSITEKLGDEVDLVILLPGKKDRRIVSIRCPNPDPVNPTRVLSWDQADPCIHKSMLGSNSIMHSFSRSGLPLVMVEPIEAHGTAIGCLKISRANYPFSQMAVRQIKAIANLVSPAVQSYRELAALDLLSVRFAEMHLDGRIYRPQEIVRIIAEILHDVFSPIATGLALDLGFQTIGPVYLGDDWVAQFIEKEIARSDWDSIPADFSHKDLKLYKKKFTATTEDIAENLINRPVIGSLIFAILKAGDEPGHPTLGASYLHRKTAATLCSDAYFDFVRDYFSSLLKKFGVTLSSTRMSVDKWFEPVEETAKEAGFSWVVAAKNGEPIQNESDPVTLDRIVEEIKSQNEITVIYDEWGIKITCFSLSSILANAKLIIELSLYNSNTTIWLGVERSGFKDEMSFASPWKNFLIDFARIADAALTRVTFAIELQRKQIEAASYQGLATAAVTIGTTIHQLSNLVHGHSASVSALLDALAVGELMANEEVQGLLHSMKRSSERMIKFLSNITNVTKTDDRRPSQLLEAVKQAGVLFEQSLLQREIRLHISVDENVMIDVPFSVATLAVANLIGNAKDAMPYGGEIRIEARSNGSLVSCRVIDQGSGITRDILDKLFDIGFTTKNGKGSGWGLYLTKRALQENRSNVELTETSEKGTTFTIHFPMAK